jgi:hypothetical protein
LDRGPFDESWTVSVAELEVFTIKLDIQLVEGLSREKLCFKEYSAIIADISINQVATECEKR